MKILMLTPYLPYPPSSGGQIRSYNLIKQLSKKHKITLCSLIKFNDEKKYVDKLKPFCDNIYLFKRPEKPWTLSNIFRTGFSLYPFLVIRNLSLTEKRSLPKIINDGGFDIIHAETFYVSPHIPKTAIPIVLVDQTIEYEVYKHYVDHYKFSILKPLLYIDVFKLKYWETYYWKRASRVIAVSERDLQIMEKVVGSNKVRLIQNGVGGDLMTEVPIHFNKTILFVGNYAWLQNIEAAHILANEVFPKIKEEIPDVKLVIAGQFTQKISQFATKDVILKDLAVDDIASIQQVYRSSGVLVAPLYGPGGTRLKILAAMAAKLPVVTTEVGIAGVGTHKESFLLGNTVEELAKWTIKVLRDKDLYRKIAINARKLVKERYSYEAIAKDLSSVYEEVADV